MRDERGSGEEVGDGEWRVEVVRLTWKGRELQVDLEWARVLHHPAVVHAAQEAHFLPQGFLVLGPGDGDGGVVYGGIPSILSGRIVEK